MTVNPHMQLGCWAQSTHLMLQKPAVLALVALATQVEVAGRGGVPKQVQPAEEKHAQTLQMGLRHLVQVLTR